MSETISGWLLLNQVSGPLFRELAEELAVQSGGATLLTDHSNMPAGYRHPQLRIEPGPRYDRATTVRRAMSWLRYFFRAIGAVFASDRRVRLLIVSNPPFLAWVGWMACRLRGQRYAVLVYDVYPGLLENLGRLPRDGVGAKVWRWSNRTTWGRAELIFTIGKYMAVNIARMLPPSAAARIRVVPNWADSAVIHPRAREDNPFAREHALGDRICVQYSGNVGATHDLQTLLAAAERLVEDSRFVFLIIGGGEQWPAIQREVARRRLHNVKLLAWQPEAILPYSLAAADVAVVTLQAGVEGHSVPSKTYYAMAAGAALLVISHGQNELVDLVQQFQCGLAVPVGDVDAVMGALNRFRNEPEFLAGCRAASRTAQERHFSRRNSTAFAAALVAAQPLSLR